MPAALAQVLDASSTDPQHGRAYEAANVIDGDMETAWFSKWGGTTNQWITFDLGGESDVRVSSIVFKARLWRGEPACLPPPPAAHRRCARSGEAGAPHPAQSPSLRATRPCKTVPLSLPPRLAGVCGGTPARGGLISHKHPPTARAIDPHPHPRPRHVSPPPRH